MRTKTFWKFPQLAGFGIHCGGLLNIASGDFMAVVTIQKRGMTKIKLNNTSKA